MEYLPWAGMVLLIAWMASVEWRLRNKRHTSSATSLRVPDMQYADKPMRPAQWDPPTNQVRVVRNPIERTMREEQEEWSNPVYLSDEQR